MNGFQPAGAVTLTPLSNGHVRFDLAVSLGGSTEVQLTTLFPNSIGLNVPLLELQARAVEAIGLKLTELGDRLRSQVRQPE